MTIKLETKIKRLLDKFPSRVGYQWNGGYPIDEYTQGDISGWIEKVRVAIKKSNSIREGKTEC